MLSLYKSQFTDPLLNSPPVTFTLCVETIECNYISIHHHTFSSWHNLSEIILLFFINDFIMSLTNKAATSVY